MPGGDGTGPMGQGPMTGGGRGWCVGATPQVEMPQGRPRLGMGWGRGRGGGWRHRNWFNATGLTGWQRAQMSWPRPDVAFPTAVSNEQFLAALKQQAQGLEQTLGELKSRIQALDKPAPDTSQKEHE